MVHINKEGLDSAKKQRKKRKEALLGLTSVPFNLDDEQQQLKLKNYIDAFELEANKMYMLQALEKGITAWVLFWIPNRMLPVPEFVSSFFTTLLFVGVAGTIVKRFSMTDFIESQEEMEKIYNWCLKDNHEQYLPTLDNTKKLESPQIQRLIKLLAPFCSPEFMIAWPRETSRVEEKGNWAKTINAGYDALTSTFSMFARPPTLTLDQQRIKELKVNVEKGELALNAFTGFEQAIRYFATSLEFRALLTTQLQKPLAMVQQILPSLSQEAIRPKLP